MVVIVQGGQGLVAIHQHWRRVSHSAHSPRQSSVSGVGLRVLGPRGSSGGTRWSPIRWTPVTAVTSRDTRKPCTPSRALGARRGGGARALPRRGGWG